MIRNLLIAGACASGLCLTAIAARADTWIEAQSEHFTLYSNSAAPTAKAFVTNLEAYYYTLYELYRMKNAGEDMERPHFTVYLLGDRRDLRDVWPDVDPLVAGFYTECEDGAAAYSTYFYTEAGGATHLNKQRGGYNYEVLFHEYAHHFMFENYAVPLPAWYVEGFAEYFSTMQIKGRDITIGAAYAERYSALLSNRWLDYGDILRGVSFKGDTGQLQFYAQSWLLTHYIMSSPERIRIFGSYIDDINAGADPVAAFETRFGLKVKDLPDLLHTYLQNGVPAVSFTFNTLPEVNIEVTTLPKSADRLLLWNSVLETCRTESLGQGFLATIESEVARHPGDPLAQRVAARAEVLLGDPAKAETSLTALAAASPQDHETHYLLGRLYYRKATAANAPDKTGDMGRARRALLAAYKLDPLYAPGLYYLSLAQADLATYPNDAAVNAAVQASNLRPSVREYAFYAAQLLIIKDRGADAAILLTPIAGDPHHPKAAATARSVIEAVHNGASKTDIMAILSASTSAEKD